MLHIVRHGRTATNAAARLQGRLDPPLDEVGFAQVAGLPRLVPRVDRLVCSPAMRARQTAAVFGVEPEIDERWVEMDYGCYDGAVISEIPSEVWTGWITDSEFAPEGGETLSQVTERVWAACEELAVAARRSEVVVVTHATPVKVAMAWALGGDPRMAWRSHVDQASVTRVLFRERGPALCAFNLVP
ncbi:MAG: histidine phosphatase family protein [Ilumatobacteraceae bacterium]